VSAAQLTGHERRWLRRWKSCRAQIAMLKTPDGDPHCTATWLERKLTAWRASREEAARAYAAEKRPLVTYQKEFHLGGVA